MKIVQERFHRASLPNGLRILHQETRGPVCHLAIIIRAGSRDEQEQEQGLAHFVEHCLFKGTAHRKTYHILSRLDDIGGELNAFTGKEDTTLYATVLDPYFRRAAELLVDIAFHSTFPEREISKEKDVVVDEIHAYADSPSDHIFDLFDELIFPIIPWVEISWVHQSPYDLLAEASFWNSPRAFTEPTGSSWPRRVL